LCFSATAPPFFPFLPNRLCAVGLAQLVDLAEGVAQADVTVVKEDVDVILPDTPLVGVEFAPRPDEDAHGRALGRVEWVGPQVEDAVVHPPVEVDGAQVGGDHADLGTIGQGRQPR